MLWMSLAVATVVSMTAANVPFSPPQASRPVAAVDPCDLRLHVAWGQAHFERGRPEPAIEAYETALQLAPDYVPALIGVVYAYNAAGRHAAAEQAARRAVQLRPIDRQARYLLGITLVIAKKQLREAEYYLLEAVDEIPQARLELMRLLLARGEVDRAMRQLERFTKEAVQVQEPGSEGATPVEIEVPAASP